MLKKWLGWNGNWKSLESSKSLEKIDVLVIWRRNEISSTFDKGFPSGMETKESCAQNIGSIDKNEENFERLQENCATVKIAGQRRGRTI